MVDTRCLTAAGAILLGLAAACARSKQPALAITHVAVVDVAHDALLHNRTVVIRRDRIERVDSSPRVPIPHGAHVVDGTGRFVIPGLWDMHVHMSDSTTAAMLLAWGITGARVMSGPLDKTLALREELRNHPRLGPRIFAAGLALHGKESFASDTGLALVQSATDARRAVDSLARRRVDFIKVHEGLSREAWFAIARSAAEHYLRLAGHVPAGLSAESLSAHGLTSIEHLEFLPDACLVIFDSTTRARHSAPAGCRQADLHLLLQQLHRNGVWLDPTISSFRVFAPRQFPSIVAGFADLAAQIRAAGLPIMAGTDLGSAGIVPGESLHDELGFLVAAGYTPAEALRAATLNPATYLQASDTLGQVADGYVADLVVLAANPLDDIRNTRRIVAVVRAGTLIQRAAADSLTRWPEAKQDAMCIFSQTVELVSNTSIFARRADVHKRARFDHTLFCQVSSQRQAAGNWEQSTKPAAEFMDVVRAAGLVDGQLHCWRQILSGTLPNTDIWL